MTLGSAVRAIVVSGVLAGSVGLAVAPVRHARAAPPAAARVSLVTIAQPDDNDTLIEDAARGLDCVQATFGGRLVTAWDPLLIKGTDPKILQAEGSGIRNALEHAARSSDLVVLWGDPATDAAIDVAIRYPRVRFVLISNIYVPHLPPNLSEGSVDRGQQAFLAGAAAALGSQSHTVGLIQATELGSEVAGYTAGARGADPRTRIFVDALSASIVWSGVDRSMPESWKSAGTAGSLEPGYHKPRKAEQVALAQFDRGADVVYAAAGSSSRGVYEAAALRHRWVIGMGGERSDQLAQRWRDRILAIITVRPDLGVYQLVSDFLMERRFPPHFTWGVTPPNSRSLLGFTIGHAATPGRARITQELDRILDGMQKRTRTIPYGERELRDFSQCLGR